MFVNFSEETQHLLKQAERQKDELNHPYVGSEHLFLSILKEKKLNEVFKKYKVTYERFKDNFDSGQFLGIQYAAIEALSNYSISRDLRIKYHNRAKRIYAIFKKYGFELNEPEGTFFLYVKAIDGFSSFEMASLLLNDYGIVSIPYNDASSYLRFSLTYETDNEEGFYEEFEKRISLFAQKKLRDIS